MWLCQVCESRHLDSQPVCPECGGGRVEVGLPFDPDTVPLSAEELRASQAFSRLRSQVLEHQARTLAITKHSNPWTRSTANAQYFFSDLRIAYRHARHKGPLSVGWWFLAALLCGTLTLLLGSMLQTWPLPAWSWLLAWVATLVVARGLIRRYRPPVVPPAGHGAV